MKGNISMQTKVTVGDQPLRAYILKLKRNSSLLHAPRSDIWIFGAASIGRKFAVSSLIGHLQWHCNTHACQCCINGASTVVQLLECGSFRPSSLQAQARHFTSNCCAQEFRLFTVSSSRACVKMVRLVTQLNVLTVPHLTFSPCCYTFRIPHTTHQSNIKSGECVKARLPSLEDWLSRQASYS